MLKLSKAGRTYEVGKALSDDFRRAIIDKILEKGGDRVSGVIPVPYTQIAEHFKVAPNTVKSIWKRFCEDYTVARLPVSGGNTQKLSQGDLELIEVIKNAKGSISLREIMDIVDELGDVEPGGVSQSTICRAVRNRMPSGRRYTRKKITQIAVERLTANNILYTQIFMNYLNAQDPYRVKFFDEAGIKLPDQCTRKYGHSPVGQRCVEITRKSQSPNFSLSALVSLNGVEYAKVIDGATNTVEFLQFFAEAGQSLNATFNLPSIYTGDIIVMDNLSCHHYDGGQILEEWLTHIGVELLYTPTYSPDLNPIEECFSKIKHLVNEDLVGRFQHHNLKVSVMNAVTKISPQDMLGYYRHTGYFRLY
jgi:transposase